METVFAPTPPTTPLWPPNRPGVRPFLKLHGLRNHFVVIDGREQAYRPTTEEIVRICDPQVGVGCDQLVVIERSERTDAFMRLYNVDGREAEACGNATRCVAWLLMGESDRADITIETLAGELACERVGELSVRCDMGTVRSDWRAIPLAADVDTLHLPVSEGPLSDPVAVNVGNPHAVFFVDDLAAVDVAGYAPAVQEHGLFPNQVNVGVAQVVANDRLKLVVYERGAGLTAACGSGACAAVYAARRRGLVDSRVVSVQLPGGEVEIAMSAADRALMTGPVEYCFAGYL